MNVVQYSIEHGHVSRLLKKLKDGKVMPIRTRKRKETREQSFSQCAYTIVTFISYSVIKILRSNTWYKIHFNIMTEMCRTVPIVWVWVYMIAFTYAQLTLPTNERASERMNEYLLSVCTRTIYPTLIIGTMDTHTHTSCQATAFKCDWCMHYKKRDKKAQLKFGKIHSCDIKLWMLIESFEIFHCAKSFHYATMIILSESSLHFRCYRRLVALASYTTSTY